MRCNQKPYFDYCRCDSWSRTALYLNPFCVTSQALQYLKKLCSHPLLVLDESPPEYIASVISAPNTRDRMAPLHELHHAPKLLALQEILEECGIGLPTSTVEGSVVADGGQHRVLIFAQFKVWEEVLVVNSLCVQLLHSRKPTGLDPCVLCLQAFLDIIEKDLFQAHMKG